MITGKLQTSCPNSWHYNGSSCVKIINVKTNFYQARELCRFHYSDLIALTSPKQQNLVENLISNQLATLSKSHQLANQSFWIGLFRKNNDQYIWLQYQYLIPEIAEEGLNFTYADDRCNLRYSIKC